MQCIFEPYVTSKNGNGTKGGVGLGLAVCRDIIREHGGDITVESTEGEGATFHITLPAAD
jgi:signal transduction histidine kinase